MSRLITDLAACAWQFGQAPRQPFSPAPRDDRAAVAEWLPARVPGDVRADLLAANRISSLDAPEDIAGASWVDEADWWYRAEIELSGSSVSTILEADGIDYLSAVYLDGDLLAMHAGMFARQTVLLPARLASLGRHELAIRVWGAGALPRLPDSLARRAVRGLLYKLGVASEYFPDRMATPKAQFSYGWDFAPRVLSTGIWDDIRLVRCRGAYLERVHAVAEPLAERDDPTPVRWTMQLRVRRFDGRALRAVVELHDAEGQPIPLSESAFDLGDGEEPSFTFDSRPLARWWPWDQGEPRLHCLTVRLMDDAGMADEVTAEVGVRTVRRERLPSGAPWRFVVNGRPVFLRGANWVPADSLPGRVTNEDYARLIGLARSAGINFLRIWGGGIREKRGFWAQCNRLGIMAMQEFPLACAFLDHYPRNAQYLAVLASEAEGMAVSLRNHPSLMAWCGGNEISPRRERLPLRTIEQVLAREDPKRPWLPASPSQGDVHQWDVWHGAAPWQSLAGQQPPFMSEFGLQALPGEETVRQMFPAGVPLSLDDDRWAGRKLQVAKLRHYAGPLPEGDLGAMIEVTQRTQAAALQAGIEACRLRREGSGSRHPCGGVAFWQWNEPWPAVSWSVIDRYGRPKGAFEMLRQSYQPVLVAARFERRKRQAGDPFRAELWWVNDGPERIDRCRVEARMGGYLVGAWDGVSLLPGSAGQIGSLECPVDTPPGSFELVCARDAEVIARNAYRLDVHLPPPQPLGAWLMRRAADLLLR